MGRRNRRACSIPPSHQFRVSNKGLSLIIWLAGTALGTTMERHLQSEFGKAEPRQRKILISSPSLLGWNPTTKTKPNLDNYSLPARPFFPLTQTANGRRSRHNQPNAKHSSSFDKPAAEQSAWLHKDQYVCL